MRRQPKTPSSAAPDYQTVDEQFWEFELRNGYDKAREMTAKHFDISEDKVEEILAGRFLVERKLLRRRPIWRRSPRPSACHGLRRLIVLLR